MLLTYFYNTIETVKLKIIRNVDLSHYSTFRLGPMARYFTAVRTPQQMIQAIDWAQKNRLGFLIIGEGSNTIFGDQPFNELVIQNKIGGQTVIKQTKKFVYITVGAGVHWDSFVHQTVKNGWSGIEALSAIPGAVGSTPIQNVGAYGQEVADTTTEVMCYDTKAKKIARLNNRNCYFSYRDSIFKTIAGKKYVILSVTFKLTKAGRMKITYPILNEHFKKRGVLSPTPVQVRRVVVKIRRAKFPDLRQHPNVGSFFKNPIVTRSQLGKLKRHFPELVYFTQPAGKMKLSAGWLIQQCGVLDYRFKGLTIDRKNSLIIINENHATFRDLTSLIDTVVTQVKQTFGLTLTVEPNIMDFHSKPKPPKSRP